MEKQRKTFVLVVSMLSVFLKFLLEILNRIVVTYFAAICIGRRLSAF